MSEQYRWFGFNSHKGWTVLIGVAVVGAAFLVILRWLIGALLFRWRFQFSILRTQFLNSSKLTINDQVFPSPAADETRTVPPVGPRS